MRVVYYQKTLTEMVDGVRTPTEVRDTFYVPERDVVFYQGIVGNGGERSMARDPATLWEAAEVADGRVPAGRDFSISRVCAYEADDILIHTLVGTANTISEQKQNFARGLDALLEQARVAQGQAQQLPMEAGSSR